MLSLSPRASIGLLVFANLLIPLAIVIFALGFFPYKPFLSGKSVFDNEDTELAQKAPYDKVIFMVVDALRSDFVFSHRSGFAFTQGLIRSGAAMPFTAHATSPTITMPRVKAMTTGSIPSFLDVILNFAESDTSSTLAYQDTWLSQLRAKPGGNLVMYGDDTWLKLFPGMFLRAEGTTSFFVSDFTEVDANVTKHVPYELNQTDWNGMILHYLGLDHIGHKSGPRSTHMIPKQMEMDDVIKQIYEALESMDHLKSTLLVLCGDHGMNDAGNHGGSTPGETSPALVFISSKLRTISSKVECPPANPASDFQYYKIIEQSDIAPTLAGLLGFPIPLNNLGIVIPELLQLWPDERSQTQLLFQNARQVLRLLKATFNHPAPDYRGGHEPCELSFSDEQNFQQQWACAESIVRGERGPSPKQSRLLEFLRRAQTIMNRTSSNYDIRMLRLTNAGLAGSSFAILLLTYGALTFASSYVEEEHQFWYWMLSGWLGILGIKVLRVQDQRRSAHATLLLMLLATTRMARRWNQTGQKHAGATDIAKHFLPAHRVTLWILVVATFLHLTYGIIQRGSPKVVPSTAMVIAIFTCLATFVFKAAFTTADSPELLPQLPRFILRPFKDISLIYQARVKVLPQAGGWYEARTLHSIVTLFLLNQTRINNVPLFLIFEIQLYILEVLELSPDELTLTSIFMQYSSFFAMGGSNAISSIDLSNAYNGVSGYNIVAVGTFTFIGNWAGAIWWSSATCLLLQRHREVVPSEQLLRHLSICTSLVASSLFFVMLACALLRAHLFVWTVFSPKYLYSIAWSLGQHLCVNSVLASLIFWL
ncbi:major facilitator super transporter protein [Varicellaria rhodocarpa]|nr:major facilitator super transporter protein [Varicellaria rhodocarpa]